MNKSSRFTVLLALFAFGVACGLYFYNPAAAQEKPKEKAVGATKHEYRIVTMHENGAEAAAKELNILGLEGYEIAFVTGTHKSRAAKFGGFVKREQQPVAATSEASPVVYYTLKRAKL